MKLASLALIAATASAADFTGTWAGVVKFDSGPPQGVCISLFEGTSVSGQVAFDRGGGAETIRSGHGEGPTIEFSAGDGRFILHGDEQAVKGTVESAGRAGAASLQSFMPHGSTNQFGPPTFGPTVLSRAQPEYSQEALEAKLQGFVTLSLEILPSGAIDPNVRVMKGLGKGLDEKAIECLLKWKFSPPRADCSAAHTPMQIQISFRLPGQ